MSKNPPIRPGLIIKAALQNKNLGISQMHHIYKEEVQRANGLRSKQDHIHPATYWSFARQCQFARALGLIEKAQERPVKYPHGDKLLTIRGKNIVPATRVIYRLTKAGRAEEEAWLNLSGAVKERLGWA